MIAVVAVKTAYAAVMAAYVAVCKGPGNRLMQQRRRLMQQWAKSQGID